MGETNKPDILADCPGEVRGRPIIAVLPFPVPFSTTSENHYLQDSTR
ncbi:hypothetical protein D777_00031 [Marinobacter nitratireducens]|uniref:Uncharacterized protein n=1 Tax=Marinobacter nitratireducens TaxID=1137280 RepID=A0A072N7R3_9GAMM|nr:hypothetical protein D777_00031 [Marinobacter nitratireducens]